MSLLSRVRPDIRVLKPYSAAEQVTEATRLNANESPWATGADRYRRPLNRYPEVRPAQLRRRLADRFGCQEERLLVTRGSSEAIDLLVRAFCDAGSDSVVVSSPSFSMYEHYARVQGAAVREVALDPDDDFQFDVSRVLDAVDESTKLVFVCSPNNPTGTQVERDAILHLLDKLRNRAAVVVDEAYIEFSSEPSLADRVEDNGNLIVLRSLSKALAHAGVRCGAAIGPAEIIATLNALQAPYALATPVVECIENAFDEDRLSEADAQVEDIVAERNRLAALFSDLPFVNRVWPSNANFLLVRFESIEQVRSIAERDGLLLRYLGAPLESCARITVGTPEENDRLLECLAQIEESHA